MENRSQSVLGLFNDDVSVIDLHYFLFLFPLEEMIRFFLIYWLLQDIDCRWLLNKFILNLTFIQIERLLSHIRTRIKNETYVMSLFVCKCTHYEFLHARTEGNEISHALKAKLKQHLSTECSHFSEVEFSPFIGKNHILQQYAISFLVSLTNTFFQSSCPPIPFLF